MVKGIIFDMDGTLVDNMMVHHRAWQQTMRKYGIDWTIEEVKEKAHGVNEELLKRLFGDKFTPEERKKVAAEKEAEYRRIFLPQLKLIAGAERFLNELKVAQIPIAIGTAAPQENAQFVFENLNLGRFFEVMVHSGDVSRGKPDPEVFEIAARQLGVPLNECVIFEDSVTGAEAALRGGCKAVVVTTTHQKEEFEHFDHVIRYMSDYSDISLDNL